MRGHEEDLWQDPLRRDWQWKLHSRFELRGVTPAVHSKRIFGKIHYEENEVCLIEASCRLESHEVWAMYSHSLLERNNPQ